MNHFFQKSLVVLALFLVVGGCSKKPVKETPKHFVSEYLPIKENTTFVYQGIGNEYASYQLNFDYTSNAKVQLRFNNGGTSYVQVWKIENEILAASHFPKEMYYRENLLEQASQNTTILLQNPILVGTSWENEENTSTITAIDHVLTTEMGSYPTIEVTTSTTSGEIKQYFAKGMGLIKQQDGAISSTLINIKEHTTFVQSVRFFLPGSDGLRYQTKEVLFLTNASTSKILEEAYLAVIAKQVPSAIRYNETHINLLTLQDDDTVLIDFKKNILFDTEVGASMEQMILQSIVNTFGEYYAVPNVILTIDNQPYRSAHFSMKPGEYFTVQVQGTQEIPE